MTPLETLRRAARELHPERSIDALARLFEAWSCARSPWRERLRREHGVYSPEVLERGVVEGLAHWGRDALVALREREVPPLSRPPGVTAVWLAGSIPTASFAALGLPLLAGSAVYAKPAAADPLSPSLFAESLRAIDAGVGRALQLGDDVAVLGAADAVVVHGRDETVAELRERVPVGRPFLGYGHKLSAGAVGSEAPLDCAAARLALELALYDGRGCLSPAQVLVEDEPPGRARALADALAAELERLARELPRGPLSDAERAWLHDVRGACAAREDAELVLSPGSTEWTVAVGRFEGGAPFHGQLRCVPLIPVRGLDEIAIRLAALAPHLSCVGHIGFGRRDRDLAQRVLEAGGSRLCPLGRMQLPPLGWHHDGGEPLRPLLGLLDVEVEA